MCCVAATAPAVGCPPCGETRPSDATPVVKLSRRMAALYWNSAVGRHPCGETQPTDGRPVAKPVRRMPPL